MDSIPSSPATAVAYVGAGLDEVSAHLADGWCRRRAAAEGWTLARKVTDPVAVPLQERRGWREILRMAAEGEIVAVITVSRSTIATTVDAWETAGRTLAALGVHLTTVHARALPVPGSAGHRT